MWIRIKPIKSIIHILTIPTYLGIIGDMDSSKT